MPTAMALSPLQSRHHKQPQLSLAVNTKPQGAIRSNIIVSPKSFSVVAAATATLGAATAFPLPVYATPHDMFVLVAYEDDTYYYCLYWYLFIFFLFRR